MDQILNKAGSYWFSQKANKELTSVGDDINDLVDELILVGAKLEKLRGEMLDPQHATAFLHRTKIIADVDYAVTVGSDLCIFIVGAR
ncbi:hypothetical protein ACE6H2_019621 [Prunus campanulata]